MSAQSDVRFFTNPHLSDYKFDWIPLGSRTCMLKLKAKDRSLCLLQICTHNAVSDYQAFVDDANNALQRVTQQNQQFFWRF